MANMLYNGVELPDINAVWTDKETYSWAGIAVVNGNRMLFLCSAPFQADTTQGVWQTSAECTYSQYALDGEQWVFDTTYSLPAGYPLQTIAAVELGWCNGGDVMDVATNTVYLAASDPVNPHITESSGNGYALYNGVKLPNIDTVWTDKEKYPYAYLFYLLPEYAEQYFGYSQMYYLHLSQHPYVWDGTRFCNSVVGSHYDTYYSNDGSDWVVDDTGVIGTDADSMGKPVDGGATVYSWSNTDLVNADNSVYLVASDPIPLDGMTVIEWDGVTNGLDTYHYFTNFCKVSGNVISAENLIGSVFGFAGARAGESIHIGYIFSAEDAMTGLPGGGYGMLNISICAAVGILPTAYEDSSPGVYLQQLPDGMVGTSVFAYTPAGSEPEEEPSTASSYLSSMLMGWIVGRRIAAQRGKVVTPDEPSGEPTGIYNDTVPLTWNSLVVTNNGAKFDYQGTPMVKISNLYGDAYDFNKYNRMNIITGGMTFTATLQGTQNIEECVGGVFVATVGTQTMQLLAISVPKAGTYADIDIPEKGIYVTDYGALMPDDSIDFESVSGSVDVTDSYIKWDGNTEGLESVAIFTDAYYYYKVTDTVPPEYVEAYTRIVYEENGTVCDVSVGDSKWSVEENDGYFNICSNRVLVVYDETAEYIGKEFTRGVWFVKASYDTDYQTTKELHFDV